MMMPSKGSLLLVLGLLVVSLYCLTDVEAKPRQPKVLPRFKSARDHENSGLSLDTTHKRVRMRPGHLSHFDHHSVKRGNLGSHAHMFNIFRLLGDFSHVASFAF